MSSTVLAVASYATTAGAVPFDLEWKSPAGCPTRDEIVDATYAQLGEHRSDASPELFVDGAVAERTGSFVVTLSMRDASGRPVGSREVPVQRPSCKQILEPTALVLAMMIAVARPREAAIDESDDGATAAAPGPTPAPPATPVQSARGRARIPAPPPVVPKPHSNRLLLGVAGVGSRGVLPSVGLGVELRALYTPGWRVLFGIDASFEQASSAVHAGTGEAIFRLFGAGARVGLSVLRTQRFEIIPFAGARLGLIQNTPQGFQISHQAIRSAALAGPGVLARVRLGDSPLFVELLAAVEGVFPRDRFQVRVDDKLYNIHRPSAVVGRAGVGLGFELR